jgi:hypothetical protein
MAILTEAIIPLETSLKNYQVQVDALDHYLPSVLASVVPGTKSVSPLFDEMTEDEIIEAFYFYNDEAGFSSMLVMIASIEAFIRTDYNDKRRKSGRFRTLYSQHRVKARLDDILDCWSQFESIHSQWVSKFRDLLRLRHWLAHGRYWNQNVGRTDYSPELVYEIGIEIFKGILAA